MRPDPTNSAELSAWFEDRRFHDIHQLAREASVHPNTVRVWARRSGIKLGEKPAERKTQVCKPVVIEVYDPAIWDNAEWFDHWYTEEEMGLRLISRMIGKPTWFVYRRLLSYDIPVRSSEESAGSDNSCCSRQWLTEYYLTQGLSLRACGQLAGVSPYTISNWLTSFDIEIRSVGEGVSRAQKGRKHSKKTKQKISDAIKKIGSVKKWIPPV